MCFQRCEPKVNIYLTKINLDLLLKRYRIFKFYFLNILDDTCKEYYEDDWIWGEEASGEEAVEETEDGDDDGSGSGSGDKGD